MSNRLCSFSMDAEVYYIHNRPCLWMDVLQKTNTHRPSLMDGMWQYTNTNRERGLWMDPAVPTPARHFVPRSKDGCPCLHKLDPPPIIS